MNEVRSETTDRLYFNGLKPDGSYGLPPKTAQELADHIWADRKREKALATQLEQALKNTDKVVEIVNFLTTQSLACLEGQSLSREAWIEALARHLLTTILGPGAAGEGNIQELARKLEVETSQEVEKIVKAFLRKGLGNQELRDLLLPQKADEAGNYRQSLNQRVQHEGLAITRDFLSPEQALILESTPAARAVWLAKFCQQLRELPIESLRALRESSSIVTDSIRQLVTRLQALPDTGSDWHTRLIHDLDPTPRLWKSIAWPTLIDILERNLSPIVQIDSLVAVDWGALLAALKAWLGILLGPTARMGLVPWADPLKLEEAGWGVIFPATMPPERLAAIQAALHPLLALREQQAGTLYKVYTGGAGYRPREDARAFLRRYGTEPSQPANPKETGVPYYLLIVGSPEEIPFEFQYGLDVQYAVGRIDFDDIEGYQAYARSVVAAERDDFRLAPDVVFFPVFNEGDEATQLSAQHLVKPVAERLQKRIAVARSGDAAALPDWNVTVISSEQTTRAKLLDVLSRDKAPALLFTASHGMQFDPDDLAKQQAYQGALVCADWQGPDEKQVLPEYYLSGDVLAAHGDANLLGTIAFLFACYGAGTPKVDDYYRQAYMDTGEVIAEQPFVAALPKAMLSLAQGGALAVIGHIERVWSLSYLGPEQRVGLGEPRRDEHLAVFESTVDRLLHGYPVGAAMDHFDVRYAALATELTAAFESITEPSDFQLAELWTANHDARGYVVIGDPAVRLKVAPTAAQATPRHDLT